jgi:hypothetical protein
MEEVTEAEKDLYYWVHDQLGSFSTHLFKAIASADTSNLNKLSKGFPDEVQVYKRYANEENYWADLKQRIEKR